MWRADTRPASGNTSRRLLGTPVMATLDSSSVRQHGSAQCLIMQVQALPAIFRRQSSSCWKFVSTYMSAVLEQCWKSMSIQRAVIGVQEVSSLCDASGRHRLRFEPRTSDFGRLSSTKSEHLRQRPSSDDLHPHPSPSLTPGAVDFTIR